MTIRLMLVDDHEVVREGLAALLSRTEDIEVAAQAGTAQEALSVARGREFDVAVLDVRLPDGSGVVLCRDLRSAYPHLRCLMLTSFADDQALLDAAMAGAAGFVLKEVRGGDLVAAIRKVAAGEQLLDPATVRMAMQRLRAEEPLLSTLTPQERRVLDLIAEGLSNRQIAERLSLAEKTVKNYVSNLLTKLGLERRSQAAAIMARRDERHRTQ